MTTDTISDKQEYRGRKIIHQGASAPIYGLGLIGAWVYYIGHASTFWLGVVGIFKGVFWPAMLVYELLKYLNM